MEEPQQLTLHRPEALQAAIDLMNGLQTGPFTSRPLIGATLDALDNGDVGTALGYIDGASLYTITGKQEVKVAAALIRQAFNL